MNIYYINRCAGDIIYSLPAIRAASQGGVIVDGLPLALHKALKPLVDVQEGFTLVHESEFGFPAGTTNLEEFRHQSEVYNMHLAKQFAKVLNVEIDLDKPWLEIPGVHYYPNRVAVVNITDRYRDKLFNWRKEIKHLKDEYSQVVFLGTEKEYEPYKDLCTYIRSNDLLSAAEMMKKAKVFSGTQSALLAIAEGTGMRYRFEHSPWYNNTVTGRANETILNKRTRKLHFALSQIQSIVRKFTAAILLFSVFSCTHKAVPQHSQTNVMDSVEFLKYHIDSVIQFHDETPYWHYDTTFIKHK